MSKVSNPLMNAVSSLQNPEAGAKDKPDPKRAAAMVERLLGEVYTRNKNDPAKAEQEAEKVRSMARLLGMSDEEFAKLKEDAKAGIKS